MSAEHRVVLKVDPKPRTALGWLIHSKVVVAEATVNAAMFSSIAALLTQLGTDTQALDVAQTKAAKNGKAATTARDAQWRVLQKSYRAFAAGVQGLMDAAPDTAHALAIAAAAALMIRLPPVRIVDGFRGKILGNGEIRLYGRRPGGRNGAFFEWQMSNDGKTWAAVATTNNAKTTVTGLTPGSAVAFRYRTTLKNVTSEWSQVISVIVH
jgi:hypothetical protein